MEVKTVTSYKVTLTQEEVDKYNAVLALQEDIPSEEWERLPRTVQNSLNKIYESVDSFLRLSGYKR